MQIRKMSENDDLAAIAEIYASSWKAAYRAIVPQEYLDSIEAKRWLPLLESGDFITYVALDNGVYAGTVSICAARDERFAGFGELVSIYLLPAYFGTGVGWPLLARALDGLKEEGYTDVYLWVLEENTRARRFYEKNGFLLSGDVMTVDIAGKELKELRYTYSLHA